MNVLENLRKLWRWLERLHTAVWLGSLFPAAIVAWIAAFFSIRWFWILIVALFAIAVGFWISFRLIGPRGGPKIQWSRVTVKLPIPIDRLNDLSSRLQQIRNRTQAKYFTLLAAKNISAERIVPDRVRVNLFVPDTQDATYGEICALFIPKTLHHGMKNEAERGIRFRPNQGLTGRVFSKMRAYGASRNSAHSEWEGIQLEGPAGPIDEGFELSIAQVSLIDPELRWIVSFPLRHTLDNASETFAVLNIDGLCEPLASEDLRAIYNELKDSVDQFADEMFKLEKCRVTIAVEDISAGGGAKH